MNNIFKNKKINIETIFFNTGLIIVLTILVFYIKLNYNLENVPWRFNFIPPYFTSLSLALSFALVAKYNIKKQNHFVTIINFNFLIFYLVKLIIIVSTEKSVVLYLLKYGDLLTFFGNFSKYIFLINIQYIFLNYILFKIFTDDFDFKHNIKKLKIEKNNFSFLLLFLSLIIFYYLIFLANISLEIDFFLIKIFLKIFDIDIFILCVTIIYFSLEKKKNYYYDAIFIVILITYIIFGLFILGSKSSLLQILLNIFIVFIVINRIYFLRVIYIFYTSIIFLLAIILFSIGNALRKFLFTEPLSVCEGNIEFHCYKVPLNMNLFITKFKNFSLNDDGEFKLLVLLQDFFNAFLNRISSIDYYFHKISNQNIISESINVIYYLKSIIDRLTPGFDIFNLPLVKNHLYSILFAKSYDHSWVANSTQFTFYAENFIIFNLLLFPYILIILLIFRFFINKILILNKNLQYTKVIGIILTYQVFWLWITGFGFDHFIVKTIYLFLFFLVFLTAEYLYEKKN